MELLARESFEYISVIDLCKVSDVTRITFYACYDDKFALAAKIYKDIFQAATAVFENLQRASSHDNAPAYFFSATGRSFEKRNGAVENVWKY